MWLRLNSNRNRATSVNGMVALAAAWAMLVRKVRRTPYISLGLVYRVSPSLMDPKPEDDGPLFRYTLAGSALLLLLWQK